MFPKTVKVGAHRYKVIYPYYFIEDNELMGSSYQFDGTLKIAKLSFDGTERAKDLIKETFLHELIHATCDIYERIEISRSDDNETIVKRLSTGWFQVLKDNDLLLDKKHEMPKSVKIGGFKWKIQYPYVFRDLTSSAMQVDYHHLTIRIGCAIETGLQASNSFTKHCLINAILKCICDSLDISKIGDDNRILSSLSEGFCQVFMDNKVQKIIRG